MSEKIIENICNGNAISQTSLLNELIELNTKRFSFPELNTQDLRAQLWTSLFEYLQNSAASHVHTPCLINVRLLSRDKTDLENIICEKWINTLLELSGLYQLTIADDELPKESSPDNVKVEALKCLCNLIYNSPTVQSLSTSNCLVEGVVNRLKMWKDYNTPQDIKFFDMRLLFFVTALHAEKRCLVKEELDALPYLIESLEEILRELTPCEVKPEAAGDTVEGDHLYYINEPHLVLVCEILKVLFNLIIESKSDTVSNEQDEISFLKLVSVCNTLLLCTSSSQEKQQELHNNVVNFLTSVPCLCYSQLAPIITDNSTTKRYEFEGRNVDVVQQLVQFLHLRISQTQNVSRQYDNLAPILTVMHKAASGHSYLRKYLRAVILPPLKDVHTRPEEGNTLRNQLCRLLTTPVTHIRDLTAQFLFILCKENVSRMVKYTGYGNAAGLFATKGLLGMNKGPSEYQYSSDSEDSDTEEYRAMRHTINPVTGCYEPPRVDPMAGCTEEQKEYEAMKLVDLMDRLNRAGIVQPCRIGQDGRPVPVEHILQLQEELPNQQVHNNN